MEQKLRRFGKQGGFMSGRWYSRSILSALIVFLIMSGLQTACAFLPPPSKDVNEVATFVAATLRAMPTATESLMEAPVPPTNQPSALLDRTDFQSVLRWVAFSIDHKRLEMLAEVIGEHGVDPFTSYRGQEFKGKDLADFVIRELRKAVEDSTPQCAGYHPGFTSQYEESAIYFYGVEPNWSDLLSNSRVVSAATALRFFRLEQGWELVNIGPVRPDIWPNLLETLSACP
jgi:hypothetical protein